MALQFLNQNRSFDETRERVRFWGHDGTTEICFIVEADALQKLDPDVARVESGLLNAFDTARSQIQDIAATIYGRSRDQASAYVLAAKDF